MDQIEIIATCPDELKGAVRSELEELGATNCREAYRAVRCEVSPADFYRVHLYARLPSRIFRPVKQFSAKTPQMLFDQARRLPWPELFKSERTYRIDATQTERGSDKMSSNDVGKKIREGILACYEARGEKAPKVELKEPKVVVVAFQHQGRCEISMDTSGKALHKRGYRQDGHPAPMKETLAAAVLRLAGYDGSQTFYDPMCGSGTLAIEAAQIALNKAPHIHRKKGEFGFEWLQEFDKDLWRQTQDQARQEQLAEPRAQIFASDVEPQYADMTRKHALKARVEKHMQVSTGDFFTNEAPAESGLLCMNLPYDERLSPGDELKEWYGRIGDTMKQRYKGWSAALLAAQESPHKFIGLKPRRRIPVMNGNIECRLLLFDLY